MDTIYLVIANSGDGSNSIYYVQDLLVLSRMESLAEDGDERFASGDGLQVTKLKFPRYFCIEHWLEDNHITLTTMEDL